MNEVEVSIREQIKIRTEINEIENKNTIEKINEAKSNKLGCQILCPRPSVRKWETIFIYVQALEACIIIGKVRGVKVREGGTSQRSDCWDPKWQTLG